MTHTTTPTDMTEIVLPGLVEPSGLQIRHRTLPVPAASQALVRIEASGISFAERSMRRGKYPGQPKFPFVPGYDLVGTVTAVGAEQDRTLIGRRVAAMTKTGGWASHALLSTADLVRVPERLDAVDAETIVVNGVTAWQMLHRDARVQPGATILVHGASGGVGTVLIQLARLHGVTVIGVASERHHEALHALGANPVAYADPDRMVTRVREIAPCGVNAVFDNIGGETLTRSWNLLAPGGVLVSYAIASGLEEPGGVLIPFVKHAAQLAWWSALPIGRRGRRTSFYNVWAGVSLRPAQFRTRFRDDLTKVFNLMRRGDITAQIAATFPLSEVAAAMTLAESRTVRGKVVLVP